MSEPKLLDLFSGAGGCAAGYARAGFDVVGVDNRPMPRYPFRFIQADALEYLRRHAQDFDVIHASPPCQAYSSKTRDKAQHPWLIEPTRTLLQAAGKPYVIENVVGAPLRNPIMLCGSMFGLRVRRHRLFESNRALFAPPCSHAWQDRDKCFRLYDHGKWFDAGIVHVFGTGGGKGAEYWPAAMGIDWMTRDELAQAIPPAFTEYLGRQILSQL